MIKSVIDRRIDEIIKLLSNGISINQVPNIQKLNRKGGTIVNDAAIHYIIVNNSGIPLALLAISAIKFPLTMYKTVNTTKMIRKKISSNIDFAILEPLRFGFINGRSFIIWPWCINLEENIFQKKRHKYIIKKQVDQWLIDVAEDTIIDANNKEIIELFQKSYRYFIDNNDINSLVNKWSKEAISLIANKSWKPKLVVQHCDLWYGNVMVEKINIKNIFKKKFRIIDWGGAMEKGFPFSDLIYYNMMFQVTPKKCAQTIIDYNIVLSSKEEKSLFIYYTIASIGFIGLNRNEFQYDRYLRLVNLMTNYLANVIDHLD